MISVTDMDLAKLDSLTKYPPILTYHALDRTGKGLHDNINIEFDGEVIVTEKIDGTNARLILLPDGNIIIGSRNELLWAYGDIIMNPTMGIVSTMFMLADEIYNYVGVRNAIYTYYFEVYGGSLLPARKNYTGNETKAFRLFDVSVITDFSMLEWDLARIASWRDNGNQTFFTETQLVDVELPRVPVISKMNGAELPRDIVGMYKFLNKTIPTTLAALDENAKGIPEGLVIRTPDRSKIAKIRYEDYAKTMMKRAR